MDASKDDGRPADGKGGYADRRKAASLPGLVGVKIKSLRARRSEMEEHIITLTLEGSPEDNGNVRLTDFINELEKFLEVSRRAEEVVSGRETRSIYYKIIGMSHSSPASIKLQACARDANYDIRSSVRREVVTSINQIDNKEDIKDKNRFHLIESLGHLTDPVGKRVKKLYLAWDSKPINLTQEFNARVNLYVVPEETCRSVFRGMLNLIDIHGNRMVFAIFPEIGPNRIQCIFPADLFEGAKKALGRRVEVFGTFHYKVNAHYPHAAEIDKIDILELDDDLPTFDDIIGIDKGLTGGLSSEDYIEKIRHEN